MMRYSLVTQPTGEPISTDEACNYLKIGAYSALTADEQAVVNTCIQTARREAEIHTYGQILSATYDLYLDDWKRKIFILKSPVTGISSIKYQDADAAQQTLSTSLYQAATSNQIGEEGRIYIYGNLPALDSNNIMDRVVIRFTCGYTNAAAVPENIISAMLMRVGSLYETRQDIITGTQVNYHPEWYDMLLNGYSYPHV